MIRVRRWLLGILGVLLLAVIAAGVTVWWAIATENGSRWLVGKAVAYAEVNVELDQLSGTIWHGLRVERVAYEDVDRRVEITGLELQVDWSTSNTAHVAITRLAAESAAVASLSESEPDPEPLNLDIPALPLRVSAETFELGALDIDGTVVQEIRIDGVDAEDLDVSVVRASAAFGEYRVQLDGFDAELVADIPLSTGVAWQAADGRWSGEGSVNGSLHRLEVEHRLFGEYPLHSVGTVDLIDLAEPSFDVVSSFDEWRYEQWVATGAQVRLVGTIKDYEATLAVNVTDGELVSATVNGELTGTDTGFTSVDLSAVTFDGNVEVTGSAQWSPALAADLTVVGDDLDLSSLTGGYATRLDVELELIAADIEKFSVHVRKLAGSYSDQPMRATGTVTRDGAQWRCESCDAAIGNNRLKTDLLANNRRISGSISVEAPALHQLHPDLAGEVRADGTLSGTFDLPILSGSLSARELVKGGVQLGGGRIRITGSPESLEVESSWGLKGNSVRFSASLERDDNTINGRVSSAHIDQRETGIWTLQEPVDFVVSPESLAVNEALWSNGDARLRLGEVTRNSESLAAEIELTGVPLKWVEPYTPEEVSVDGYVDALLRLRQSSGEWSGRFEWQQRDTALDVRLIDGEEFRVAVPTATAMASLEPSGATVQARLEADGGVMIDLNGSASGLSRDAIIDARLVASGEEWGWIAAFIPEIDEVVGSVKADFTARGRADDLQLQGELRLTDGEVVLPAFNVPITNIQARLTATSSDSLDLVGDAQAGEGRLAITGSIRDAISTKPRLEITLRGSEAMVLNWPDYALVASPDLSLNGEGNQYKVEGRVRMDRAEILVRELPEGAVTPSADVSVAGRQENDARATRLSGAIEIELSDSVHVRAFGLDTNLEGELRIELPPDREPRANGELSLVGGFFEMYGQRLEVERGRMLFSGPMDNPFVDVRVVREIDGDVGDITVGVDITGRADSLVSTLYSNPAMTESEILSYLVTGRPLVDASTADGQLLSDAAFFLGLRQAAVITNQIGQAVGLDELVLEGTGQESTALVAGKQVSRNLYARYRYGVFSRLGELLLRYSLSESISIEIGAGEYQSIDVQYTIERD